MRSGLGSSRGCYPNAAVSGFFVGCYKARGYHPPLVNVEATDTDKRGELALCLLSEHLSGQSKVGFNKSAALKLNSLDKRELLSLWITLWITYPQAALRVNTLCVKEKKVNQEKRRTVTMTQDEIIEMAKQANAIPIHKDFNQLALIGTENIEAFAKLVAQHEREACAKVCDKVECGPAMMIEERHTAAECARKIRARVQA